MQGLPSEFAFVFAHRGALTACLSGPSPDPLRPRFSQPKRQIPPLVRYHKPRNWRLAFFCTLSGVTKRNGRREPVKLMRYQRTTHKRSNSSAHLRCHIVLFAIDCWEQTAFVCLRSVIDSSSIHSSFLTSIFPATNRDFFILF
jgi:hypothetical protein